MVRWDRGEQGPQPEEWMIDAMWILIRAAPTASPAAPAGSTRISPE